MRGYITDPSASGGLRFADDLPEPEPGTDEALVEVRAFGINRGELNLLATRPEEWRPGQDLAGVVVRAAANGAGPAAGTPVVAISEMYGWAERIALPSNVVAELPSDVSFEQGAALPIAGLTALRALRLGGHLLGREVLVTGATGGVGQFAVQLARAAGARVTGQVSGRERYDMARRLGASVAVTDPDDGSVGPFDLVLDGVGGGVLQAAIHRLAPGATAVTYGTMGSKAELGHADFRGAPGARLVGHFHAYPRETRGHDLAILAQQIAEGRLDPLLGMVRDWSELRDVLDAFRKRRIRGKAVLTVS